MNTYGLANSVRTYIPAWYSHFKSFMVDSVKTLGLSLLCLHNIENRLQIWQE